MNDATNVKNYPLKRLFGLVDVIYFSEFQISSSTIDDFSETNQNFSREFSSKKKTKNKSYVN